MTDPTTFVLDTYALLAYFQGEPGASRIEKLLENAIKEKCRLVLSIIDLEELLDLLHKLASSFEFQIADSSD